MSLDGYCDHTAMVADEELHQHYTDLLNAAGVILYGRITYQLMEYWRTVLENPTGKKDMDEFAIAIDRVPKIVFSNTLNNLDWTTATLARRSFQEEVVNLKQEPGKDIFLGSPSMIVAATNLGLVDEYQLCIHPTIVGKGLPLFKNIRDQFFLKLRQTKTFNSGTVAHYYEPVSTV